MIPEDLVETLRSKAGGGVIEKPEFITNMAPTLEDMDSAEEVDGFGLRIAGYEVETTGIGHRVETTFVIEFGRSTVTLSAKLYNELFTNAQVYADNTHWSQENKRNIM